MVFEEAINENEWQTDCTLFSLELMAAQLCVTLSRHTALNLAVNIRRKGGFLTLITAILIIMFAQY